MRDARREHRLHRSAVAPAFAVAVSLTLTAACSPDEGSIELGVHLVTDLRPALDFQAVHTRVHAPGLEGRSVGESSSPAFATQNFFEGERVAEVGSLPRGQLGVIVELLDGRGAIVAWRPVLAEVRSHTLITVVITADCERVECPRAGDPEGATACFGGRCVPPECSDEDPTACGPLECTVASDCAPGPACATARCASGVCTYAAVDARCTADEYCHPARGCTPRPEAVDGGASDAGPRDAGPSDAGMRDTGPPDTGPPDARSCGMGCGTCGAGECCTESCSGCDLTCPDGCECYGTCTGGTCAAASSGGRLDYTCRGDCPVDCTGSADCVLHCEAGATCRLDCTGGAVCRLECDPGAITCGFGDCFGGIVGCPGGVVLCNSSEC